MCGVDDVLSSSILCYCGYRVCYFLLFPFVIVFGLERAYRSPHARRGLTPSWGTPLVPVGDFMGGI